MWPWSGVELRDIGGRRSRSRSVGYSLRGCNVWPRYTLMASCSDAPQTAPRQPMPAVEQSMGPFFEFQLLIAVTYIHASVQLMQKSFLKFPFPLFPRKSVSRRKGSNRNIATKWTYPFHRSRIDSATGFFLYFLHLVGFEISGIILARISTPLCTIDLSWNSSTRDVVSLRVPVSKR